MNHLKDATHLIEFTITFSMGYGYNYSSNNRKIIGSQWNGTELLVEGNRDTVTRKDIAEYNCTLIESIDYRYTGGVEVNAVLTGYAVKESTLHDLVEQFNEEVTSHIKSIIFKLSKYL